MYVYSSNMILCMYVYVYLYVLCINTYVHMYIQYILLYCGKHVNMHAVCKRKIHAVYTYMHSHMYILYRSTHYIRAYVCIMFAGQYPQISDDLVNSHHLLLCCVDTLYNAVLLGDKMDLINMESLRAGV